MDHLHRPLVYVAGPYTHPDPVQNTHNAVRVAERIQSTVLVTAFVPHLNLLWHAIIPHDNDYWYEYDIAFLARCDALLRIPGDSVGADNEVEFARHEMIDVFDDVDKLLEWSRSW